MSSAASSPGVVVVSSVVVVSVVPVVSEVSVVPVADDGSSPESTAAKTTAAKRPRSRIESVRVMSLRMGASIEERLPASGQGAVSARTALR